MISPYMLIIWSCKSKTAISKDIVQRLYNLLKHFFTLWFMQYVQVQFQQAPSLFTEQTIQKIIHLHSCKRVCPLFTWSLSQFWSSSVLRSSRLSVCLLFVTKKPATGTDANAAMYRVICPLTSSPLKQTKQTRTKEEERLCVTNQPISFIFAVIYRNVWRSPDCHGTNTETNNQTHIQHQLTLANTV